MNEYIVPFESVGKDDIETVGGKNASLGEMISALSEEGIDVPAGFAITALA
jgi:pyruvate,water dikinase